MKKVSLILSTVVMTAIGMSSCVSEETNNDSISAELSDPYIVEYKNLTNYALPKESEIQLDWRFDETYDQFVERYKKETPSFAGYFIVLDAGCGTCCRYYQIIDTRDGKVYSSPKKKEWGEEGGSGYATYKRESSLFRVVMDDCGFGDGWSDTLFTYWDDSEKVFKELQTKRTDSSDKINNDNKSGAVNSSTNAKNPENGNFVITVNGRKIEVYQYDYKEKESYLNTNTIVSKKGNGWRLPSVEELKVMCKSLYHKGKGNFKRYGIYWSNEQECDICPVWVVEFEPVPFHDTGRISESDYAYIRMVRDLD